MSSAAVVLAAGGGTRFEGEGHKLRATVLGRPLVARAVEAACAAGLDEVFVVVGAVDVADVLPPGVVVVANERWREGIATSLHAGVRAADAAGHDAVVVGLGDQPFVPASAWRAVADAAQGRPIVVATYGGKRGNPVRLHRSVWPSLPVAGDEGARALFRGLPQLVGEVACEGESADVDTVEDLGRWS